MTVYVVSFVSGVVVGHLLCMVMWRLLFTRYGSIIRMAVSRFATYYRGWMRKTIRIGNKGQGTVVSRMGWHQLACGCLRNLSEETTRATDSPGKYCVKHRGSFAILPEQVAVIMIRCQARRCSVSRVWGSRATLTARTVATSHHIRTGHVVHLWTSEDEGSVEAIGEKQGESLF